MAKQKIVAITGASNGMGYEAAKLFASKGWKIYAGARRVEKIPTDENITAIKLDVTNSASNHAFVERILEKMGHIDVLINNAGYGEYGPAEEISMANIRKQFETNFFGAVELTQLVLPKMRAQNFGRIVNISSIGGDLYMPLGAYYHATKAALQQWSDALDLEVSPFGIRSVIVQPGGTRSNWGAIAVDNAEKNLKADSPYKVIVADVKSVLESNLVSESGATSADLAKVFYKASTNRRPKRRYFNSLGDKAVVHIARSMPNVLKFSIKIIMKQVAKKRK